MTVTTTGVETEEDLAELVDKEGELSTVKRGRAMHQKIYYYNDHRCIIIVIIIIIIIITVYSPQLCGHLLQPAHLLRLLQAVHLGAVQQAGLQVSGQCRVLVTHIMVIAAVIEVPHDGAQAVLRARRHPLQRGPEEPGQAAEHLLHLRGREEVQCPGYRHSTRLQVMSESVLVAAFPNCHCFWCSDPRSG